MGSAACGATCMGIGTRKSTRRSVGNLALEGFTLPKRPAGPGPVVLDLSLDGARASASGESLRITTSTGRKLGYGMLHAVDAAGTSLRVAMSAPTADRIRLEVDDAGAVYPIVIDPLLTAAADTQLEADQAICLLDACRQHDNGDIRFTA